MTYKTPAIPLVFMPGFMADARLWAPQIEALSGDHPIHLIPWGRAESVEQAASEMLAHAPPKFALIGHSLGGMVAMEVLRRVPDRVNRIALFNTACMPEVPPVAAERELRIARVKAGRLASVIHEDVPDTALADGPMRAPLLQFLAEMACSLGEGSYLRQSRAMQRRPDQQRTLRQARLPALVLCGAEDGVFLPRRHEFIAGLMPNADLRILPDAGHLPMLERPVAVTEALRQWMARPQEALLLR